MSYQIQIFKNLRSSYLSWDELQTYLTSPEGGNIRVVGEGRYRVLRYVKGVSDLTLPHVGWMRSVVWDTETNLPVCVAPPKAEKNDPTGETVSYSLIQDFLDGIMINVFHTAQSPNVLQIATRTQIGAGGKFYSEKTFQQMFDEALTAMGFTRQTILSHLPVNNFASFVLQHPEHRVVARCRNPRLWVVHKGAVRNDGDVAIDESCLEWPQKLQLPTHPLQQTKDLPKYFEETCKAVGWFYEGMTFKDGKGRRWRLRNPNYMVLRSLRGSEATAVDRFLRLRSESKVSEYLKHYSEDRQTFWDLEQTLRAKTQEVFQGYCSVHKLREKKLEDLPWEIKPCVFKLHSHYLEHLRPNNEKIYMKHAVELVNNLALYEQKRLLSPPSRQTSAS